MVKFFILTEKECVAKGGHVYDDSIAYITIGFPSKEHPTMRICKYCGHKQRGYYPEMIWEDTNE